MAAVNDSLPVVLMATHEQAGGEQIAKILSKNNYCRTPTASKDLCLFTFQATFQGRLSTVKLVCGFTQLVNVEISSPHLNWMNSSEYELFSAVIVRNDNVEIGDAIKKLACKAVSLVLCFESDLEGEYLGAQLIDILSGITTNVHRIKFGSYADEEIERSFANPIAPNQYKALCVTIRQDIDLRVGSAMTRYIEMRMKPLNHTLQQVPRLMLFGPEMAPLLFLCVQQYEQVKAYRPAHKLHCNVTAQRPESTQHFQFNWIKNGTLGAPSQTDKQSIQDVFEKKCDALRSQLTGRARITRVERQTKTKLPPKPLDQMLLLQRASEELQFAPKQTMTIALSLYYGGYITYPRTHNTSHSSRFDYGSLLDQLQPCIDFEALVYEVSSSSPLVKKSRRQSSANATLSQSQRISPITPIRLPNKAELDESSWSLFELITRHFLISLMQPLVYEELLIELQIGPETFSWTGNKVQQYGYTFRVPNETPIEEAYPSVLPQPDDEWIVNGCDLKSEPSTAPRCWTEGELLARLSELGIGRFTINVSDVIQSMCDLGYVEIIEDRRMKPTEIGVELVTLFERDAPGLIRPEVRVELEQTLPQIACCKVEYKQAMFDFVEQYKKLFNQFKNKSDSWGGSVQDSPITSKSPPPSPQQPLVSTVRSCPPPVPIDPFTVQDQPPMSGYRNNSSSAYKKKTWQGWSDRQDNRSAPYNNSKPSYNQNQGQDNRSTPYNHPKPSYGQNQGQDNRSTPYNNSKPSYGQNQGQDNRSTPYNNSKPSYGQNQGQDNRSTPYNDSKPSYGQNQGQDNRSTPYNNSKSSYGHNQGQGRGRGSYFRNNFNRSEPNYSHNP
jgi:DNA topoisomerase IA